MATADSMLAHDFPANHHMSPSPSVVRVIDLDGTLRRGDAFLEGLLQLLCKRPLLALHALTLILTRGRSAAKHYTAANSVLPLESANLEPAVVQYLRDEKQAGATLILATGAARPDADRVAAAVDLFDDVLASEPGRNFTGRVKAQALVARFGERNFDYMGDSFADIPVWRHARRAIYAGRSNIVWWWLRQMRPDAERLAVSGPRLTDWLAALRITQWSKNLILFVPLLAAHRVAEAGAWTTLFIAALAMSLAASAIYLVNDLLDREHDRAHWKKRSRPIAAGLIDIKPAIAVIAVLLCASALLAWRVNGMFQIWLGLYAVLALAYSLGLKRVALVDVFVLAALYVIRVIAGGMAVSVPVSSWLLAFSLFFFLSLALLKRYAELSRLDPGTAAPGRGYRTEDQFMIASLGLAAGMISALVFALYFASPDATRLYRHPAILWTILPLVLFWMSRLWLLASRRQMDDDPVAFALSDWPSHVIGVAVIAVVLAAT